MSDRRDAQPRDQEPLDEREEQEEEGPVVRDKRRVDPDTGEVRRSAEEPASTPPAGSDEAGEPMTGQVVTGQDENASADSAGATAGEAGELGDPAELAEQVASLQAQLSSAMADTQRVQAEYANYRKRVDRDREAVREQALANVLTDLLPVLDDIGRAREHGELQGGFRQVAESLEQIVSKLGMVRFGEAGDPFDPTIHEALMHSYSDEVTETTCAQILQAGYAVNERVLRPARVAVAEPESHQREEQAAEAADTQEASGSASETDEG